jgi:hypothetical protein
MLIDDVDESLPACRVEASELANVLLFLSFWA